MRTHEHNRKVGGILVSAGLMFNYLANRVKTLDNSQLSGKSAYDELQTNSLEQNTDDTN
jgi:hypothetical protein